MESDALACLADASAYPLDPSSSAGIERIDTHISHVFLTGTRAYKFRRPVKLAFLDFSRADERARDCLRELVLNRRLSPDVYLGVAPLRRSAGRCCVGACADALSATPDVVEHCVVMRRLERGRDLHTLLAAGSIQARHIDAIAATMAVFHAAHGLGVPAPFPACDWLETTTGPARANFDALLSVDPAIVDHARVREARELAERFASERSADFEERRRRGRVVDGHGDLHTEHIWFETDQSPPLIVDCLEFREDFRRIDAASDVAFLAMDLTYRGYPDLASRFLRRYARDSGDFHLFSVVDYFAGYRALVRAKVAALVAGDASMSAAQRSGAASSVRRHLELGMTLLAPRRPGATLLICGLIGSGKTTVAEVLADLLGAVVISSDRVRKSRAGLAPDQSLRTEHGQGAYREDRRAQVYADLLAEARPVVRSGRTVILDATHAKRDWREQARIWAVGEGSPCSLVEVKADESDALARLRERAVRGGDASDAGPELYAAMRAQFEAPLAGAGDWPARRHFVIDTSRPQWHEDARKAAAALTAAQ
ncbi:MAG: AAA family ATPase [Deltaproteobacteria bacterium]|nr:AAA family ATPase [Deltaproteobacteria bacterium]